MSTSEPRYEMLWDCPGCSTQKLLGLTHRHCPNCGAPQDPTRRYFPAAGEEVAVADHPYHGVDKQCAGCDTPNGARAEFCCSCGAPLDGAKTVGTREQQTSAEGAFAAASAANAVAEDRAEKAAERAAAVERHAVASGHAAVAPSGGGGLIKVGVGLVAVVLIAVCAAFFLWKKEAAVTVTAHRWERTIEVETLAPTTDRAWKESVPAAASDVRCQREQKESKQVADGESCVDKRQDKGDGTFTVTQECTPKYRDEPVYGEMCRFSITKWTTTRTERAQGTGTGATWPAVALFPTGNVVGAQREGKRAASYALDLRDEASGAASSCAVGEARWKSVVDNTRWKAQVGVVSGAIDCDAMVAM